MGLRFRKKINLGNGFRINLSKSGVGCSVGMKGARATLTSNGRLRSTTSIPGTGLSYVTESSKSKKNHNKSNNVKYCHDEKYINMFDKFHLTDGEISLLDFLINQDDLEAEFTPHDISCKGYSTSSTYYTNLYDKGLLLKPSRGVYALNVELLEKAAKDAERSRKEADLYNLKKQKNKTCIYAFCFIPWIILFLIESLLTCKLGYIIFSIACIFVEVLFIRKNKKLKPKIIIAEEELNKFV